MIECVIDLEVPIYCNSQTALRRKIGIAHAVLRWRAEFRWPPRPCAPYWRSDKQAGRGWHLATGCWIHTTPLLLVRRSLALHLTACRLRLHEVESHEERGELYTQPIDRRFEG